MSRNVSIDFLKAIAIFGVVFIHSAGLLGCESAISEIFQSLFRFAVPCFVIVWAYFVEKSLMVKDRSQQFQYLIQRFVHLFRVFMLWSTLYFLVLVNWSTLTPVKLITTHFSGFGWEGQYYIIVLCQLLVLFPLIRWIYEKKYLAIVVTCMVVAIYFVFAYLQLPPLVDSFGYRVFVYWIPYVFFGVYLSRNQFAITNLKPFDKSEHMLVSSKKRFLVSKWWLLTVLLIPAESWLMKCSGGFNDMNNYVRPVLLFVAVVISGVAIQYNTKQDNIIFSIGRKTMVIFLANPLVIHLLKILFISLDLHSLSNCSLFSRVIFPFVSAFLVLVLCLLIDKIIKLMKLDTILI